jgi:hypothetical protein
MGTVSGSGAAGGIVRGEDLSYIPGMTRRLRWLLMTERKPRSMSFTSWIDQQIADAEKRGVFDNLPGAGKPLNLKPGGDEDYGQAWIRDYARREGVPAEEFLPTPLKLRKETERLAEAVEQMRSEDEVRSVVSDLNRRIVQWRRAPVGPPIFVRLVNSDEMVARWRQAQAATRPAAAAGEKRPGEVSGQPLAHPSHSSQEPQPRHTRRWRRLRRILAISSMVR